MRTEYKCRYLRVWKHYTKEDTYHCVMGNNATPIKCTTHRYDCDDKRLKKIDTGP